MRLTSNDLSSALLLLGCGYFRSTISNHSEIRSDNGVITISLTLFIYIILGSVQEHRIGFKSNDDGRRSNSCFIKDN